MNKKLVIFGSGEIAELAHWYFKNDSEHDVAAFTLDREYITTDTFCGLPVVPFEYLTTAYPPSEFNLFVAIGYSKHNAARKEKYFAAKEAGYTLPSFISSKATVLNGGAFGDNCFIFEDNTIQPFVKIGSNVTLWSGNHIGHHSTVGDHSFLASHIVVSGGCHIGEQVFIGVNASLRDHISIGDRCIIGAGTLILADAEADSTYKGEATEKYVRPSR